MSLTDLKNYTVPKSEVKSIKREFLFNRSEYKKVEADFVSKFKDKYNHSEAYKRRVDYATAREKYKVNDNIILYESYFGRGLICSPYAMFLNFKKDSRFSKFKHVWVLDNLEQHPVELEEYKNDSSVIFVEAHSLEYFKYLSSAKYLITNVTFQAYFTKKPEQIIINTWHGIPLKHLGYDTPNGNVEVSNSLRNFLMSDYIISANKFTTDNFKTAYKLDGMYQGKLIETGYPRNDTIINTDRDAFIEKLKKHGVNIDPNKKLVLYAPTWKGAAYKNPLLDVEGYDDFLDTVYSYINRDEYQVLFKPHQIVYKTLLDKGMLKDYYIPATVDTNELLSITDILVSDYSSIFFDFLVTDRPILFFIPDVETYAEERGLYFDVNDLPGPIATTADQIGEWVADIENYKTQFDYNNYVKTKKWAVEYDDGHATDRIKEVILGGHSDAIVHTIDKHDKIKLLITNDTMKTNGITSSVCNLLDHLDYEKYDVTFYGGGNPGGSALEAQNNICSINKNVRVIYRNTTFNGTFKQIIDNDLTLYHGVDKMKAMKRFPVDFYRNEYLRCFTGTEFDYIINFSGYSNILSLVFASNYDAKKLIWMHNDMFAERDRFEDGEIRFNVLDTIYPYYDKLVSCAHSVMDVNIANLSTPRLEGKFSYAKNLMSKDRIDACLEQKVLVNFDDKTYYAKSDSKITNGGLSITLFENLDTNCINFVTMGRLSPEKNHENLIHAFKLLREKHDNVRLYILGAGPLQDNLTKLIKQLELTSDIKLTGNLANPFSFVNECDCYIMPSLHEGQPMAIMEARLLNKPIIVSNFSTVKDSLYDKGQYLIETDVDSILGGLEAFIAGEVPNEYRFDIDKYNKEALAEFENNLNF